MSRRVLSPTARNRLSAAVDRLSAAVARRFEVDLRALAAFRIAVGALIVVDLLSRARTLEAFYTDAGVLPREALFSDYSGSYAYSLHAVSGEAWAQALLFALASVVALALVAGYRTRTATVASWLLLLSLHLRNPMVLNGGDVLLRMLLFWGIFLPLGERWSIDARRVDRDRTTVASVGTMALLLQVLLMYVTNSIHKLQGDLWVEGEALVYVMQVDQLTVLLGNVLAEFHPLLRVLTYAWLALLVCSPLLVLLTGYYRAVVTTLLAGMHLGMLVTMRIDLFPLIVVAGLLPFYQTPIWDRATAAASRFGIATPLRRGLSTLQRGIPAVDVPGTDAIADATSARPDLESVAAGGRAAFSVAIPWLFLVLVVLANAQAVDYAEVPEAGQDVLDATKTDQSWRLFAPNPTRTTRWFVFPGELEDGTEVDALRGSAVDWDRPPNVERTLETARWRKYLSNVRSADNENHRSYLANHLCERWNDRHETELATVTVAYAYETFDPDEETDPTRAELVEYDCGGEFVQPTS